MSALKWMFAVVLLLTGGDARAALITATYCVTYSVSYTDGASGDFLTGSTYPARGVDIRFVKPDNSYFDYYADINGCATPVLDNATTYTVKSLRKASLNDNYLAVLIQGAGGYGIGASTMYTHIPVSGQTYSYTTGVTDGINVMAAATRALYAHDAGLSNETFEFWVDECPGDSDNSCYSADKIYINPTNGDPDEKFIIAHEMGHAVTDLKNGNNGMNSDYDANVGDCSPAYDNGGHKYNSKEYASAAWTEGVANAYAAFSFNDDVVGVSTDCEYQARNTQDWNLDGDTNDPGDVEVFSCEDGTGLPAGFTQGSDWLGAHCLATGAIHNRGLEYDVLRHMWDMRTNEAVTVANLFDIVDKANPNSWTISGAGTTSDYPTPRMSSGAFTVGGSSMQNDWDSQATFNGLDP